MVALYDEQMWSTHIHAHMWSWSTKPVLSRWGIFVAIAKNTLHGSKWSIFLLCSMKIFSTFLTVNISKLHFWLVICIAKNFIWTALKAIFSIFRFFCTPRLLANNGLNNLNKWDLIVKCYQCNLFIIQSDHIYSQDCWIHVEYFYNAFITFLDHVSYRSFQWWDKNLSGLILTCVSKITKVVWVWNDTRVSKQRKTTVTQLPLTCTA